MRFDNLTVGLMKPNWKPRAVLFSTSAGSLFINTDPQILQHRDIYTRTTGWAACHSCFRASLFCWRWVWHCSVNLTTGTGMWGRKQKRALSIICSRQAAQALVPNPEARRVLNSHVFLNTVHKHTGLSVLFTHLCVTTNFTLTLLLTKTFSLNYFFLPLSFEAEMCLTKFVVLVPLLLKKKKFNNQATLVNLQRT